MPQFPLIGPSYTSQSVNADCQTTMNLYPEVIESGAGNNQIVLYPAPGTKQFVDLTPPTGGLQNVRMALTAGQLNSSFASPIVFVPAQGPDLIIVPLSAVVQYTFGTVPYINAGGLNPIIGLGANTATIQKSFVLPIDPSLFRASVNGIEQLAALPSWQNLPPASIVNQPLCWTDSIGATNNSGNGTAVVNVQFFVLNVATGKIVNGLPKKIHGAINQLSTVQIKNASNVPIQIAPAPGPNQLIIPLTAVVWHHFGTVHFNILPFPEIGFGTVPADINNSSILFNFDNNAYTFSADSMEQVGARFYSNIDSSKVVNQPLAYINFTNIGSSTGDGTITVYTQYLVVDLAAGTLIDGTGDLKNARVTLTSAQIKASNTLGVSLVPPAGANQLHIPQYSVGQSNFNTTPYSGGNDPNGRISPSPDAVNTIKLSLITFSTSGGPFTFWESNSNQMILEPAIFYQAPNTLLGSNILPAVVINQPIEWGNFGSLAGVPGDTAITLNIQYVTMDTNSGALQTNL